MKLSLSSSRRRPPSPALLTLAAAVRTQFRLCWRGKCVGRSSIERPCWNCRGPRGAVSRMLEEERITEQASDVVEVLGAWRKRWPKTSKSALLPRAFV